MTIWTGTYWKDQVERVIASAAGAAVSVVTADAVFDAVNADWAAVGSVALGAGIVSLLKGLAANAAKKDGQGASAVPSVSAVDRRKPAVPTAHHDSWNHPGL